MGQMLKCPQCGKYTQPGPASCEHCGASLRGATRVEVAAIPAPEPSQRAPLVEVRAQRVIVTDVDMPFGSMVRFMVKWSIASIPAIIILLFLGFIVLGLLGGVAALGRLL